MSEVPLYRKVRDVLVKALKSLVSILIAALTLVVLWGVLTRFCLGKQASYTDELARMLLIWASMFGGALAFGMKAHLGVDYFVGKMHPEARKFLSLVVQVITAILAVVVFIIGGWVLASAQFGQQLPTMPWLTRGAVYASIPVSGLFIVLFSAENFLEILRTPAEKLGAQTQSEG